MPRRPSSERLLAAALCLALPMAALGAERLPALKAAYTYYFSKFVDWPDTTPGGPLVLCVATGEGEQRAQFATLASKRLGDRPLEIVDLPARADASPANSHERCHILYLGADVDAGWALRLQGGDGVGLLVVADEAALPLPAAIRFKLQASRLGFEIDARLAEAHGLSVSAKLLALAAGH